MPEKKKEMEELAKLLVEKFGARALDLEELEEVSGGMSHGLEEYKSLLYWSMLFEVDPSLEGRFDADLWNKVDIEFEDRDKKYFYKDKVTGKELDFYGAWALVLKRVDKRIGGARTDDIDFRFNWIYENLSRLMSEGY